MKLLIGFLALLFSITAFSAPNIYKIEMSFSIDGKNISRSTIVVEEGKMGTVEQETKDEKNFFEVVTTEGEISGKKGILMKFKVGHILKNGTRKAQFKPTLLAKNGEEASITLIEENKKEMTLKVTASRQ